MAGPALASPPPPKPKRNRNEFVRENVPLTERVVSTLIVCLIIGVGVAIWVKGKQFDPGRYALRTDALKSTTSAVDGKAGTLRIQGQTQPGEEGASSPAPVKAEAQPAEAEPAEGGAEGGTTALSKAAIKGEPLEINLPGLTPMSPTEFYNSDNLFEKIDGRAPAYQNFNVQQLRCRTFSVTAAAGSYVDVYEFRFDSTVDAFGMFAMERDPKGRELDFASDGYSGEMGYFFRQGTVYVQVIASDQKPETSGLALAIARNRAKVLPVDDSGLAGRRKLPADGMIPDTVAFVAENAQGQASLNNVFQAKYKFAGAELPFFVMVTKPDEAVAAWKSFMEFCKRFGQAEALPDASGASLFRAQIFGKWKVVYQRNGEVGGVFDADDAAKAQEFIQNYLKGVIR